MLVLKNIRSTFFFTYLFAFSAMLISCSPRNEIKANIKKMSTEPIKIATNKMLIWSPNSKCKSVTINNYKYKMVVFVNKTQCSSCFVKNMVEWKELLKLEKGKKREIIFLFILDVEQKNEKMLREDLKQSGFDHFVLIDKNSSFVKLNPNIPSSPLYHSFLLDKDNNVILVGSPLHNNNIKNLLFERLNINKQNY